MNTKGHPLRVAFCIYFKPVNLKKSPPHYRGTIKHGTDRGATLPAQ